MSSLPFKQIDTVSRYFEFDRFMDMIGEGAFSVVYKALRRNPDDPSQPPFGPPVALKVIPKNKLDSERAVRDIINEVEIAKMANHPNCMKFIDVYQSSLEVFMVLELAEGEELFELVRTSPGGRLPEQAAVVILAQVLDAVNFLHERRVVHRDLKPENIVVQGTPDQPETLNVKIVDFGLAKYYGTSTRRMRILPTAGGGGITRPTIGRRASRLTSAGSNASVDSIDSSDSHHHPDSPMLTTPCGTLKYNAPESVKSMVSNGGEMQKTTKGDLPKRDIFSVGVIAYIVLSGQLPFNAKTKVALFDQMAKGVSFDSPRWQAVTQTGRNFVGSLLDVTPANRPSAHEALRHQWLGPVANSLPSVIQQQQQQQQRPSRHRTSVDATAPQGSADPHHQQQQQQQQQQHNVSSSSSQSQQTTPVLPSQKQQQQQHPDEDAAVTRRSLKEARLAMSSAFDSMYELADEVGPGHNPPQQTDEFVVPAPVPQTVVLGPTVEAAVEANRFIVQQQQQVMLQMATQQNQQALMASTQPAAVMGTPQPSAGLSIMETPQPSNDSSLVPMNTPHTSYDQPTGPAPPSLDAADGEDDDAGPQQVE